MTWKLSNGTTILQNFVHKEVDCTPRRLSYWQHYMNKVWNEDGIAECCYDVSPTFYSLFAFIDESIFLKNECNGLRPEQESGYTHLPAEVVRRDFKEDCSSIRMAFVFFSRILGKMAPESSWHALIAHR